MLIQTDLTTEATKTTIANAVASHQRCVVNVTNRTRAGSMFATSLALEPLADLATGDVTHYLGTMLDSEAEARRCSAASSVEASLGHMRLHIQDAAMRCARLGEVPLLAMVSAVVPVLDPSKGLSLRALVNTVLMGQTRLSEPQFLWSVNQILGEDAAVLAYFNKCLHHYGTAHFCDP